MSYCAEFSHAVIPAGTVAGIKLRRNGFSQNLCPGVKPARKTNNTNATSEEARAQHYLWVVWSFFGLSRQGTRVSWSSWGHTMIALGVHSTMGWGLHSVGKSRVQSEAAHVCTGGIKLC